MHGIHGVFPSPEVIHHTGGKDSISTKKLAKGDARWKPKEELLGVLFHGWAGKDRMISIPPSKHQKYWDTLTGALDAPRGIIGFNQFRKLHGQIQYVTSVIPCMKFLMTPLNRRLTRQGEAIGLGKTTLSLMRLRHLLDIAQAQPTHILAIVAPGLLHYYGTADAVVVGAGGVWLPCLRDIQPTMWQVKWPDEIEAAVRHGTLSMEDCELGAYFLQECLLDHLLGGDEAGISTHVFFNNTPMVGRIKRKSSGGESTFSEAMLECLGMRQLIPGQGPADC
jgi:hypothetical protein